MLLQVVCTGPLPVCGTLELHKKVHSFFFGVVRLEGVWWGGVGVHVSGGNFLDGLQIHHI